MAGLHLHLHLQTNLSRSSSPRPPSAYQPTTTLLNPTRNAPYWDSIYSDIHTHLKKSIPIREPVTVYEPMHHLTFAPPIATASALCVAACEAVGGHRDDAIVAASAIHLMHATIHTHDNLLLSTKKISEPVSEISRKFTPGIELMTGDGILPFGFELLTGADANDNENDNSEKILKVVIEISRAMGAQGMINGGDDETSDEVGSDQWRGQPRRQLHGCGAACGAIMGGGSTKEIEQLRRFGVFVGKIQGVLSGKGGSGGGEMGLVEKWRGLALKELECFDSKRVEQISSIVNVLCD
ncbi:putative isoprenoid synthase domain superfamily [Helianthus annuus]|nr:putative isoprenoid synthase domain superfamily [Helianthus annuus]